MMKNRGRLFSKIRKVGMLISGFMSPFVFAADQTDKNPSMIENSLGQVVWALLFVIAAIVGLSYLAKKMNVIPGTGNDLIKVVGGITLNNKDRLLLVQIGEEQLLLGATPGRINKIHKMEEPITVAENQGQSSVSKEKFSRILKSFNSGADS